MHLDRPIRILATAALTAGVAAGAAGAFAATTASASPDPGHAVFLETDQVSGNQILSYDRSTDGSVSYAGTFATGGDGATAAGATADPLASQGGLALT